MSANESGRRTGTGKRAALAGIALALSMTAPAWSQSGVEIKVFQFTPATLEVKAGTRVAFSNGDDIEHTVTSGTPDARDGRFDVRLPGKGTRGSIELVTPGVCSANPGLPKAIVAELVKHHVVTLKDVIDAQAKGDADRAYAAVRTAASHMQMIADPLAEAIVKQFPDRF